MYSSLLSAVVHTLVAGGIALASSAERSRDIVSGASEAAQQARRITLVTAPTGNEARYRVREQLVGLEFPNDAVGKTDKISGSLAFESSGQIVKEDSKFTVELASLQSDRDMRDNYVRNNTLRTAQFPTAVFVPVSAAGLPASLPAAGDLKFQLMGDLTVVGVTKPATWEVEGRMEANGAFKGTATTSFNFAEFGLTIPRVRSVLSVVDKITLEYDLNLVPRSGSAMR